MRDARESSHQQGARAHEGASVESGKVGCERDKERIKDYEKHGDKEKRDCKIHEQNVKSDKSGEEENVCDESQSDNESNKNNSEKVNDKKINSKENNDEKVKIEIKKAAR